MNKTQKSREEFAERYYSETNKLSDNDLWKFCRSEKVANIFEEVLQKVLSQREAEVRKEIEESRGNNYHNIGIGSLDYHEKSAVDAYIETLKSRLSQLKNHEK